MLDSGPHFSVDNSPFCSVTGKLTRLFKGGSKPRQQKPQVAAAAKAAETPQLVGQAEDDGLSKEQKKRKRNNSVVAATSDATFGQKLKLGQ